MKTNNKDTFFSLLKAGLFSVHGERNSELRIDGTTDWNVVYQLAQEQSVQGVVLQGIDWFKEHDSGFTIPQVLLLEWIGEVQMIEQQNKEMNLFIADLIEKLRKNDIYALLVKGQGVAQCYEKPLWRVSGDVDLLLSVDNYEKAKTFLTPFAEHVDPEERVMKHLGMTIGEWVVELHGTMHTEISQRVNRVIDEVQDACFKKGGVRSWNNVGTNILLPSPDNDFILVFTHILEHFFVEGVGLKQVCDWCRLLWIYRSDLDLQLLESRIRKMGLMTEWKIFGSMAVYVLGIPKGAMPFYDE